jgi:uncharacterized RDD family membrane protein YckC
MASQKCISCGYKNLPEARFCANCGASLLKPVDQPAPAVAPGTEPAIPETAVEYMGFWIRLGAAIIDCLIIFAVLCIIGPLIYILMHRAPAITFLSYFIPFLYYWLFTGLRGQTLGKMALGIKVVNAEGSIPGLGMAALREIPGKILSFVVIFLGFLWIIWDGQKQGWHDKIAKTHVLRVKSRR